MKPVLLNHFIERFHRPVLGIELYGVASDLIFTAKFFLHSLTAALASSYDAGGILFFGLVRFKKEFHA